MNGIESRANTQIKFSGRAFSIRLFVVYGLFVSLHHLIYPETGGTTNWTPAQFVVLSILTYTIDFLAPLLVLGIIFILTSKVVPSFRSTPTLVLLTRALYTAIPIYGLMLLGWHSYNQLLATS